jgi:hypothetical protein
VLFGCKGKQIKERLMIPWTVRRMNASVTNQFMPKHSLETLATIRKSKYFGHTIHSSDSMKKNLILGLTDGSGKLRKTVYKVFSRNMRNRDDELVQQLNCHVKQNAMEGPDLQGHEKQEISEQIRGSKTQYFLLTQSIRITRGHL